jgi:hypothetical protein
MNIILSNHAIGRLIERTGITVKEFKKIYEEDKVLPIGLEKRSSRIHELFYSYPKKQSFVSIRDERNLEIITILPIDYHKTCAWAVDHRALSKAKEIFYGKKYFNINQKEMPFEATGVIYIFASLKGSLIGGVRKKIGEYDFGDDSYDFDLIDSSLSIKSIIKDYYSKDGNDINYFKYIIFAKEQSNTASGSKERMITLNVCNAKDFLSKTNETTKKLTATQQKKGATKNDLY